MLHMIVEEAENSTGGGRSKNNENYTFPRRSRGLQALQPARMVNWDQLLAKATEEDKKSNIDVSYPINDASDDSDSGTNTENIPPSPMNLSAPRIKSNFNENALDLSAEPKSARKGYTLPTYNDQCKEYPNPPLLSRRTLNPSRAGAPQLALSMKEDVQVSSKKTVFAPTQFVLERNMSVHKQVCATIDNRRTAPESYSEVDSGIGKFDLPEDRYHAPPLNNYCYSQPPKPTLVSNNGFAVPSIPGKYRSSGKELVVNGKTYQTLALLGKGGSSKVYLVLANDNSLLAIKCVNLANVDEKTKQDYLNEIKHLLKMQNCKHIIKIIDHEFVESRKLLYAVMERGDTDLSRLVKERITSGEGIPPQMIIFYWSEILLAVKSIHDNNIIHRDLKPANFLLVAGRLKLIDFGIASAIQSDTTSVFKDSQSGTPNYMSPEAWEDLEIGNQQLVKIGRKTDVWSLGCILYTFLYGRTPFQEYTNPVAKFRAITNPMHVIKFPPVPGVPHVLVESCRRCLIYDKNKRASIDELLKMQNQILMTRGEVLEKLHTALDNETYDKIAAALQENT